jgi:tellurite resistance protein TerC
MISSEHIIFAGFLVFIAAILALDLGIFDKKSHEVKFREALIWTLIWVGLGVGFYFLLLYFGDRLHGIKTVEDIQYRIDTYKHTYNILGVTDFQEAVHIYRKNLALEYITGYLIEYMLSVDNVFVMILVFMSFGVQKMYYKRVLMWGIIGAVIMRFVSL